MGKNLNSTKKWMASVAVLSTAAGVFGLNATTQAQAKDAVQNLTFEFPVAVAGPMAQYVNDLVNSFNSTHPSIHVTPEFAGDYTTVMTKVQTGFKSGNAPDVACLLSTDLWSLVDMNAILPIDNFAKSDADQKWLKSFYPAFMANSVAQGKTWGIPFQRSTVVMYYNKSLFKQAGLNPNHGPQTWDDLVSYAKKLTKSDGSQYGLEIPTSGTTYWLFLPFAIENGQNVVGDAGNKVTFTSPAVVQALQFFSDLSKKDGIEPSGLIDWMTAPTDFETGKAAMIYHSSGSLAGILAKSKFPVGVAMLPENKRYGTPTGGGNLYIMDTKNTAKEQAAYEFVKWMSSPENAAKWSMETGYVATSPAAYQVPAMVKYLHQTPQADVAHRQLRYAAKELGTHEGQRIQQLLSTACQQVLTSNVSPKDALANAQKQANTILSQYKN